MDVEAGSKRFKLSGKNVSVSVKVAEMLESCLFTLIYRDLWVQKNFYFVGIRH